MINNQSDIDNVYLCTKDLYEAKYQYLLNKRKKVGLDHFKNPTAFLNIQVICKMFIKVLKKRKILKLFDDMIADMINNKRLNPVVTELFLEAEN